MEMSRRFIDLFFELEGKPELIEKILCLLDHGSLRNIQCVCRYWNKSVSESRFWKLMLQHEIKYSIVWKQIYGRLMQYPAVANYTEKEVFGIILNSVKRLNSTWQTRSPLVREIQLSHNMQMTGNRRDFLTMDDKWIAVGSFIAGEIQMFDRSSLQLSKIMYHARLYFIQFHKEMLFSGSPSEIKIWDSNSGKLLENVALGDTPASCKDIKPCFAVNNNLLVCCKNMFYRDGILSKNIKLAVWRLKDRVQAGITQLVLQQDIESIQNSSSPIRTLARRTEISDRFFMVEMIHSDSTSKELSNDDRFIIELRSIASCEIVHVIVQQRILRSVKFFNDKLLFQEFNAFRAGPGNIKFFDCKNQAFSVITFPPEMKKTFLIISCNSQYAAAVSNVEQCILDPQQGIEMIGTSLFKICPSLPPSTSVERFSRLVGRLQNLRLKTELLNRGCLQDFIMDEISILQYSRFENPTSGKVVYNKLILSDFLLEDQFFDKQHFNSADASSCMNCGEKSKELKHCCPCRKVRYCSLSCQRTDWTEHKVDCCV